MLTAVIILAAIAASLACWFAYALGRTANIRHSQQYKAGTAHGYRKGIVKGEHERDMLRERVTELDAALDEMGRIYDRKVAEPVARAVAAVYDHQEDGL